MTTNSRNALALLAAVGAGVVIGILIAPEKGSDLREKVRGSANDLADELLAALGKRKNDVAEKASELKGRAEAKLGQWKEDAEDGVQSLKRKAESHLS
ncbi:Gas vesicle protein [Pseudarcicella hirudinis]|uniref:Gas vesicle protein n=1 Tax=Pseudarcicella hirudinis TaxID=1079859 RepID=A0A1I5XEF1_9BACT|nr:YtxH domain-containing protein [Pseudarcicella hirudinis]SFQ30047.1 Gas vesicle protein [Pseudarcicella hirudinis]